MGSGPGHGVGKGPEAGTELGVQGLRGAVWLDQKGGKGDSVRSRLRPEAHPWSLASCWDLCPCLRALCPDEAPGLVSCPTSPSPSPSCLGKPAWLLASPLYLAPWQFPGCGRGRIRVNPEIVLGPSPGPLGVGTSRSPVIMRLSSCLADPGTQGWETVDGNRTGTGGL